MKTKTVIASIKLEVKTKERTKEDAIEFAENIELPSEYKENSFEVVNVVDNDDLECPMCNAPMEYKLLEYNTHAYSCQDCAFVGFEFNEMENAKTIYKHFKV